MLILGTDQSGKVLLVSEGKDGSVMPNEHNGVNITAFVLTKEQEIEYRALPEDRGGMMFDGVELTALAAEIPPLRGKDVAEKLVDVLVRKGTISAAEADEVKEARQRDR